MKLRKQLRFLSRSLREQTIDILLETHRHDTFFLKGSGCTLCSLLDRGYAFAALQLARENGYVQQWLDAEREMYELIGKEAFEEKISKEIELAKSFPKKACTNCGGLVTLIHKPQAIARTIMETSGQHYETDCKECGNIVTFNKSDLPANLIEKAETYLAYRNKKLKALIAKKQAKLAGGAPERIARARARAEERIARRLDREPLFNAEPDIDEF
jgi:RNase P subunit RPR2